MKHALSIALLACMLLPPSLPAKDFSGGDFAGGKNGWLGEGKLVHLNEEGTPVTAAGPGTTPAIELNLSSSMFRDISQKFTTEEGTGKLNVEIVYKASPDYKLNEKSSRFTKDNTWTGGTYYWSALVYPKVDLCIRLDKADGYSYKMVQIKPSTDWQTVKFAWDNVGEKKDAKLSILVPPGDGKLYVKSVTVSK